MKLHLPLSLRSALLSCVALAGGAFTAVSGTLAVGTATIVMISAHEAQAATASGLWPEDWTWEPEGITYQNITSDRHSRGAVNPMADDTKATIANYMPNPDSPALPQEGNLGASFNFAGRDVVLTTGTWTNAAGETITTGNDTIALPEGATYTPLEGNLTINLNNNITANSTWIAQGRFQMGNGNNTNRLENAGALYLVGGQLLFGTGNAVTLTNTVTLGASRFADGTASDYAALSTARNLTLNGQVTLVEDARIATIGGGALTIGEGKLATNGHTLAKSGAGTLSLSANPGITLDGFIMAQGTFKTTASGDNKSVDLGGLDIQGSGKFDHSGWNSIWNMGRLTSSAASSADVTLTLDYSGNHYFRQTYKFEDNSEIAPENLYAGTIALQSTGAKNNGNWQMVVYAGSASQLSKTSFTLGNYTILGITGDSVELGSLSSTNKNAYVFSGANTSTTRTSSGNNGATPLYQTDGQVRTITLGLTGDFSYLGTLAGNLIVEKNGGGTQVLGSLGDNVTVNLHAGTLRLQGLVGNGSTIVADAGTTVVLPWALTVDGNVTTATYGTGGIPDYILGEGRVVLDSIAATGDTGDAPSDTSYTVLDANGYTGDQVKIITGLVSIFQKETTEAADYGSIETFVLSDSGFVANTTEAGSYTFSKNLVLDGSGYFRVYGSATTTAVVTGSISGSGTFTKTSGGSLTLSGDMSGFTGGIAVGQGLLTFNTDATVASLVLRNNGKIGVSGPHRVQVLSASGYVTPGNKNSVIELDGGGDLTLAGINFNNGQLTPSTFTLQKKEGAATGGSVTTAHIHIANNYLAQGNLVVGQDTALNVTGTDTPTSSNFVLGNTFVVNHWGHAGVTINGTLNMLNCSYFSMVAPMSNTVITAESGSVLNLLGAGVKWRDGAGALTLTLKAGSMLNLGSMGLRANQGNIHPFTLQLQGGSLGILASTTAWSGAWDLTLEADTVVNTELYTPSTDGSAGSYIGGEGTITLSGAITGTGTLIKQGAGFLLLNNVGNLRIDKGYVGVSHAGEASTGTLTIGNLATMTGESGRFLINLGANGASDLVTAQSYGNQLVNLTLQGGEGGTYTVFNGGAELVDKSLIDLELFLNRGVAFDAETGLNIVGGQVQITLTGTASTDNYDLTWAGEAGETWSNTAVEAWEGDDQAGGRFSAGDRVFFNGGGSTDVTILGIVTPGAITVTGDTNYSFNGGQLEGAGILTKEGTGTLKLDTDTSKWTGNVVLNGGTLAFTGTLGSANTITATGNVELAWLYGNTTDISGRLQLGESTTLTLNTGDGTVLFGTAIANSGTFIKTGAGTLRLNVLRSLTGDFTVSNGTLELAASNENNGAGAFVGSITVQNGAVLLLSKTAALGWSDGSRMTTLLLEEGSVMRAGAGVIKQTISQTGLTMRGGSIVADEATFELELSRAGVINIEGTAMSTIGVKVLLDDQGSGEDATTFNVSNVTEGTDLLITGVVTGNRGTRRLVKSGEGTMEISGKYTAGEFIVNAGSLVLHEATLSGSWTVAQTANLTITDGTCLWDLNHADRTVTGNLTLDKGGILQTRSDWKYHTTLAADATLSGSGTWVTGFPTTGDQYTDFRNLYLNGSTAGFTGTLEMWGSALVDGTQAWRTALYLNSADGEMNGIVKMQGAVYNGGWGVADETVVPLQSEVILQKSMIVGGFEGTGGILRTDAAGDARVTLTVGRDDDHIFSGSVNGQIDLVKTGSGKQTFNGDLSAFDGAITLQNGTLDMGSLNHAKSLAITGANARFTTTGKVTIGAGQTLSITATGAVIDAQLDLSGGLMTLGDISTENHSASLNGHSLTLSSTDRTSLELTLGGDLSAGTAIDLITGISELLEGDVALTLGADALLATYFNVGDISALNDAKLQLSDGKLQIVLARGTNSLLYGQGDNGVWQADAVFDGGTGTFTDGANVEFSAITSGDAMTVKLEGDLSAGSISIEAGAGKTYHFVQNGDVNPDSQRLVVFNGMTIRTGTADFAAHTLQPTADATISVANGGTLSLQTDATNEHVHIELQDGSTLLWGDGNTTDYAAGNRLAIADMARVTLDINGNRIVLGAADGSGVTGSTGHITLADTATGGSLLLGSGAALHGTVDLNNQTLRLEGGTANGYDLSITGNGTLIARGEVTLSGANTFTGELHIGDNSDTVGDAVNGTLHASQTSLGANVTGIVLIASNTGEGSTLNYTATADAVLGAAITGTGDVNIAGSHEITLTGANTYAGTTGIGANTTLKVTDKSLSAHTEIGNVGDAGGTLHLTNTQTDGALDFANRIGGDVAVTVSGGTLNWLADADHAKTYTGTTTIAANTSVTASGPLTTGENSKIVLEGAGSVLSLDLSASGLTQWTSGHTVSGAGMLVIRAENQTITGENLAKLISANDSSLSALNLTAGTLDVTGDDQADTLKKISSLEIGDGARLAVRSLGMQDQAGLALSIAGAGTGTAGSNTAAALFFDKMVSEATTISLTRDLSLAADAAVYVEDNVTGALAGSYTSNSHTLTKTGTGILRFEDAAKAASGNFVVQAGTLEYTGSGTYNHTVTLETGTTLSVFSPAIAGTDATIAGVTLLGDATLQTANFGGTLHIANLAGTDKTLTVKGASSADKTQYIVLDGGALSGSVNVVQSDNGNKRSLVFGVTSGALLQNATVNLSQRTSANGTLGMVIGGDADGIIHLGGLDGIAETWLVSGNTFTKRDGEPADLAASLTDGNHRTLQIDGPGNHTFAGSIGANLAVVMNGAGNQSFSGTLADETSFSAKVGTLAISSTEQTGSHRFAAQGGILDMAGYTRATNAVGTDTIVYEGGSISNLQLRSGMELGAGASYTGAILLDGHTVLGGGTLSFRLTDNHGTYEDLATSYTVGTSGTIALAQDSTTTMLTFIPVNKKLDPTNNEDGKDYTLIANVGDAFGTEPGEVDKDALGLAFNMSNSGRTQYTLKVVLNDDGTKSLVLNVQGAAADLTWNGNSTTWNTEKDNLAWNNGTADAAFMDDDYVIFDTLDSAQEIQIAETGARMAGMIVVGDTDYTFEGGSITSSSGLDTATLTIGTVDTLDEETGTTIPGKEFTGTLTLNTENSYAGETVLNSGKVVAGTALALSTTALTINGGTLHLNFEGTLATSGVTMNGGSINAQADSTIANLTVAGTAAEKTFSADGGRTLTLVSARGTLEGALKIGSADKTGTVLLNIETRSLQTAGTIAILGGKLTLSGGATGSFTGANVALEGGDLQVTGGLVATLGGLSGTGGNVVIDASTLAFSQTADIAARMEATNAIIRSAGTLTLGDLHLVSGTTALTGPVILNGLAAQADTTLAVGLSGGAAGSVTLGAGVTSLADVSLANGTLTVKDGDSLTFLESWGTLASTSAARVTLGAAWLKNGATIDPALTVILTGSDALTGDKAKSWLGDVEGGTATTLGKVVVNGAAADVNLGGQVVLDSITIEEGKVTTHYNSNTVTNGITLAGANATLDLLQAAPNTAIILQQGSLLNASNYTGTVTFKDAPENTAFAMGGLTNKATVSLGQLAEGSFLAGLGSLKLGDSTLRVSQAMQPLFVMNDAATGTVSLADGATVSIVCGSVIQDVLRNKTGAYALTNGSLSGLMDGAQFKNGIIFDPTLGLYNVAASIDGGNLVFTVLDADKDPDALYRSSDDGTAINSYAAMDGIAKVDIDRDTVIDLTGATLPDTQTEDGLLVKNLHNTGDKASSLTIRGTNGDLVTLNNNLQDTWYDGDLMVEGATLQVRHTDASGDNPDLSQRELTILGSLTSTGELILANGKLTVNGDKSDLNGGITFNDDPGAGEKGLLTLNGDTSIGGLVQGGGGTSADIQVGNGATVTLKHGTELHAWMAGTHAETLALAENASVTLSENARIEGMGLQLNSNSTAIIQSKQDNLTFNGLSGNGALAGETGTQLGLALQEGTTALYEGDMSNWRGTFSVTGAGMQVLTSSGTSATLHVVNGHVTLRNSGKADSTLAWGESTLAGGSLHFDTRTATDDGVLANSRLSLTSLTVTPPTARDGAAGNSLVFDMNLTNDLAHGGNALVTVAGTNAHVVAGTTVTVNVHGIARDFTFTPGETMSFTLLEGLDGTLTDASQLAFTGSTSLLKKYFGSVSLTIDGNRLQMTGTAISADEMHYHQDAGTTETGRTGGALMDYLFITANPQGTAPGSLAANVLDSLEDLIDNRNPNTDRVLSSIGGSTVTALGSSFAAGLESQMTSIRNRMTGMGVDANYVNEDMPYFHAWISANAGDTRLDADNTLAGYKLTSTGGTVGVDVDVSDHLTLGASFTASYGDLTADGAEMANGHLDTYTAALFAHAQVHRWTHNLVLAVSTADADLDRTVDYGAGSYKTMGSTNGIGFGALYETTFDIRVGEDGESLLQPLFRASLTHTSIDGYSETGAESMGLNVGKQDITYATFGLGARYIAAIGENVFNRTATLELRAMILQDAGSRRGEADVALRGAPGRTRTVRGAEPGSTGVQVGASLNVPIEESSSIFADVNLDARSKTTSINGSVGYRINF